MTRASSISRSRIAEPMCKERAWNHLHSFQFGDATVLSAQCAKSYAASAFSWMIALMLRRTGDGAFE